MRRELKGIRPLKEDKLSFRLQKRHMNELAKRAEAYGVSPSIIARSYLIETLEQSREMELLEKMDELEKKINSFYQFVVSSLSEVFYITGTLNREEIKQVFSDKKPNNKTSL